MSDFIYYYYLFFAHKWALGTLGSAAVLFYIVMYYVLHYQQNTFCL